MQALWPRVQLATVEMARRARAEQQGGLGSSGRRASSWITRSRGALPQGFLGSSDRRALLDHPRTRCAALRCAAAATMPILRPMQASSSQCRLICPLSVV
eukprot:366462-Chlamydomonas_euryale.AAC.23